MIVLKGITILLLGAVVVLGVKQRDFDISISSLDEIYSLVTLSHFNEHDLDLSVVRNFHLGLVQIFQSLKVEQFEYVLNTGFIDSKWDFDTHFPSNGYLKIDIRPDDYEEFVQFLSVWTGTAVSVIDARNMIISHLDQDIYRFEINFPREVLCTENWNKWFSANEVRDNVFIESDLFNTKRVFENGGFKQLIWKAKRSKNLIVFESELRTIEKYLNDKLMNNIIVDNFFNLDKVMEHSISSERYFPVVAHQRIIGFESNSKGSLILTLQNLDENVEHTISVQQSCPYFLYWLFHQHKVQVLNVPNFHEDWMPSSKASQFVALYNVNFQHLTVTDRIHKILGISVDEKNWLTSLLQPRNTVRLSRLPSVLSMVVTLPPNSTLRFELPFSQPLLPISHFPADASRGFDIPAAKIDIIDGKTKSYSHKSLFSESPIVMMAFTDFSMPFNVVVLVSVLYVMVLGSLFNVLMRRKRLSSFSRIMSFFEKKKNIKEVSETLDVDADISN